MKDIRTVKHIHLRILKDADVWSDSCSSKLNSKERTKGSN